MSRNRLVGYSNSEYYEMILCVGAAHGNISEAVRLYRERFIDGRPLVEQRRLPSHTCLRNLCLRLQSTGSFHPSRREGRPRTRDPALEEQILEHFEDNPRTSTRRAGAAFDVNRMAVWRILHEDGQHPYHFRRTQELTPVDFPVRVNFCTWYRNRVADDPEYAVRILWTDEASFTRSGVLNLHNEHVWCHVNPHAASTSSFQHQWRINVWAGIIGDRIIGPAILPASLNAANYLRHLNDYVDDHLMEELSVLDYFRVVYQHDGAPAHFAHEVRNYLNRQFSEWIGRGGSVPWPPRSPDLTPLDFFLWGYIKNFVYAVECETRDQMEDRIRTAFSTVTPQMLHNVRASIVRRAALCIEKEGRHFEPFL